MPVAGAYFVDVALAILVPKAVFEDASYHWYVYVAAKSILVTVAASTTLLPISIFLSPIDDNIGLLGFIITYLLVFPLNSFFFKEDYSFERAIISWGTLTGVLITGMTLLKICDPEYKSPALSEFSLGFSLMSVTGLLIVPILNTVLAVGSTFDNFITAIISAILYFVFAFMIFSFRKKSNN